MAAKGPINYSGSESNLEGSGRRRESSEYMDSDSSDNDTSSSEESEEEEEESEPETSNSPMVNSI